MLCKCGTTLGKPDGQIQYEWGVAHLVYWCLACSRITLDNGVTRLTFQPEDSLDLIPPRAQVYIPTTGKKKTQIPFAQPTLDIPHRR